MPFIGQVEQDPSRYNRLRRCVSVVPTVEWEDAGNIIEPVATPANLYAINDMYAASGVPLYRPENVTVCSATVNTVDIISRAVGHMKAERRLSQGVIELTPEEEKEEMKPVVSLGGYRLSRGDDE